MTKQVVAFVCEFCPRKKRFAVKGAATRHENSCFYNPARRACATCENLTLVPLEAPSCAKGILPIVGGPEEPDQVMTADCAEWEPALENSP